MVLTVPEAARFLRVSEDVVYRLCASGEIPARCRWRRIACQTRGGRASVWADRAKTPAG